MVPQPSAATEVTTEPILAQAEYERLREKQTATGKSAASNIPTTRSAVSIGSLMRPNENKMSGRYLRRAELEVNVI